jgi:hypothetical protein
MPKVFICGSEKIHPSMPLCSKRCANSSSASEKTLIAAEQETQRVKDLRFAHRLWSFTIDPRNLVFVDETGIHLGMTRLQGLATSVGCAPTSS